MIHEFTHTMHMVITLIIVKPGEVCLKVQVHENVPDIHSTHVPVRVYLHLLHSKCGKVCSTYCIILNVFYRIIIIIIIIHYIESDVDVHVGDIYIVSK